MYVWFATNSDGFVYVLITEMSFDVFLIVSILFYYTATACCGYRWMVVLIVSNLVLYGIYEYKAKNLFIILTIIDEQMHCV